MLQHVLVHQAGRPDDDVRGSNRGGTAQREQVGSTRSGADEGHLATTGSVGS